MFNDFSLRGDWGHVTDKTYQGRASLWLLILSITFSPFHKRWGKRMIELWACWERERERERCNVEVKCLYVPCKNLFKCDFLCFPQIQYLSLKWSNLKVSFRKNQSNFEKCPWSTQTLVVRAISNTQRQTNKTFFISLPFVALFVWHSHTFLLTLILTRSFGLIYFKPMDGII